MKKTYTLCFIRMNSFGCIHTAVIKDEKCIVFIISLAFAFVFEFSARYVIKKSCAAVFK